MIRKKNNHTLQINPRHHEEEPQKNSKATRFHLLVKMIAKLEGTRSNASQYNDQTQNSRK